MVKSDLEFSLKDYLLGGGVEFLTKGKKGYNTKTMPIWNESS